MNQKTKEKYLTILKKRKDQNALRSLKQLNHLIDFSSNDYLSIARMDIHGVGHGGSGGSRLLSGNHPIHESFEKYIATQHGYPASLLFNSGYMANTGVISTLCGEDDVILYDELIHASIKEGIRLSGAEAYPFKHNDIEHLKIRLNSVKGNVWVLVESVYSMDGDFAPLQDIAFLQKNHDFNWMVDEAHGVGVFGKGKGLVAELNLQNQVDVCVLTFGKALGSSGAIVLSSDLVISYLINLSKQLIYTTSLSPKEVDRLWKAYLLMLERQPELIELNEKVKWFRGHISEPNRLISESNSLIQAVLFPGNDTVTKVAQFLQEKGLDVRPIMSPTVRKGRERIRVCFHTHNTLEEVQLLTNLINSFLETERGVVISKL